MTSLVATQRGGPPSGFRIQVDSGSEYALSVSTGGLKQDFAVKNSRQQFENCPTDARFPPFGLILHET